MRALRPVLIGIAILLLATPALAHVPSFPADNTSPDQALVVTDATKSYSFYDRLAPGQVKYYRLSLSAGQRLRVGTFTPSDSAFTPSVVLLSPSLNGSAAGVPPGVTVPDGMGATVVFGDRPEAARYEPFAPSASYHTLTLDQPVESETTYLVAVYEPTNASGKVGVTTGYREEFSPTEYLTVPFDLVQVHLWEGQHPLVVFGPLLGTLLGGALLVRDRRRGDWTNPALRYGLAGGALLIAGSGVRTAVEMGVALATSGLTPAALVTVGFVVVPIVAGGWALRLALREDITLSRRTRSGLAIAALTSLITWGGFVVGPAILLGLGLLPGRFVDP